MFKPVKRTLALVAAAGVLCVVGSAIASGSASAYNFYPSSTSTTPWLQGTKYTATTSSFAFTSATSSATYLRCTSVTVSGATTGVNSTGHNVGGATFSGCTIAGGSPVTLRPCAAPWQFTPTSGSAPGPIIGTISGVCLSVTCPGGTTANYSGNLTTGVTWVDSNSPPSMLKLANAASLSRTSGTCAALPSNVNVTATLTTASVNGSPASATNNLWLR